MKTETKPNQLHKCKWCDYANQWKAAVINHIKGNHAGKWLGNWEATMGVPGAKPGLSANERAKRRRKRLKPSVRQLVEKALTRNVDRTAERKKKLEDRRRYNRRLRLQYLLDNKTTSGRPRQQPIRESTLRNYPELLQGKNNLPKNRRAFWSGPAPEDNATTIADACRRILKEAATDLLKESLEVHEES